MDEIKPSYCYRAELVGVVDGDTVIADIDLGFGVWLRSHRLRLLNYNAPELLKKIYEEEPGDSQYILDHAGYMAKKRLEDLFKDALDIMVVTKKDRLDKYGRILAKFFVCRVCPDCGGKKKKNKKNPCTCKNGKIWFCVNDFLLKENVGQSCD